MTFAIGLLARLGAGQRPAMILAYAAIALAAVSAILWLRADAYSAGVRATDTKWHQASDKLKSTASKSAATADASAAKREAKWVDQVGLEKEKLDEAERNNSSPFDVLFGPPDGVR